jgi:hypothetical protein
LPVARLGQVLLGHVVRAHQLEAILDEDDVRGARLEEHPDAEGERDELQRADDREVELESLLALPVDDEDDDGPEHQVDAGDEEEEVTPARGGEERAGIPEPAQQQENDGRYAQGGREVDRGSAKAIQHAVSE